MNSGTDDPCGPGFPIRKSTDQSLLAAPRGLSQRAASFVASRCQGIHQMPLKRLSFLSTMSRTAAKPPSEDSKGRCRMIETSRIRRPSPRKNPPPHETRPKSTRVPEDPTMTEATARSSGLDQKNLFTMSNTRVQNPLVPRPGVRTSGDGDTPRAKLSYDPQTLSRAPHRHRATAPRNRRPRLVEVNGIEPMTSCLQSRRSPN